MMNESLKQLRLERSSKFNEFCEKILAHQGTYPKSVGRQLANYRWLFTAILNDRELRELAADDLRRLTEIEQHIKERNAAQA